jgi:DHA1 family bicyclomycin/chloramphenicol resistance-like MFS transporter
LIGKPVPSLWLLTVLAVLLGFASISTDLYLPALPAMGAAMGADEGTLELTISGYLLGFSVGQLFWGPLSDRFGRRFPLLAGLLLFVVGSAGCALAGDPWTLVGCRLVQAVGASAGVVLARAMVRDLYDRDQSARVLSTLMTVMAVAPLLGPTVGGQILAISSWQAIFWTLVVIGSLTMVAVFTLPETLAAAARHAGGAWQSIAGYAPLLRNRVFLGYVGVGAFFYAGVFAYVAGTPAAYISYYGLAPQLYGLLFAASTIGLMVANTVNARLVTRLGSDRMLLIGTCGAMIVGVATAIVSATGLGGLFGLAAVLVLFISMNGLILANSIAGALSSTNAGTGTASALAGFAQYGGGVIGSAAVGAFANGTPLPMGCVVAVAGIGSVLCLLWGRRGTPS